MSVVTLPRIAIGLAISLKAQPLPNSHRALFEGGEICLGEREIAVLFHGVGCLFVSVAAGTIVIEAAAFNNGEPRDVVLKRHVEIERRSRELFGDEIELRDPLGLRGGKPAVVS